MSNYYLDIETTGPNPKVDKIVTIQFVELERSTAVQKGELKILKEWESSEREMLLSFISESKITDRYAFAFVPIGYNLGFEHKFILERCKANALQPIGILNRPFIDLRSLGVLMNRGEFKDSGLDKITGKPHNGRIIPKWYIEKKWQEIENYVTVEAKEFIQFCAWVYNELPPLLARFRAETGLVT